jgi:hypothetical protein
MIRTSVSSIYQIRGGKGHPETGGGDSDKPAGDGLGREIAADQGLPRPGDPVPEAGIAGKAKNGVGQGLGQGFVAKNDVFPIGEKFFDRGNAPGDDRPAYSHRLEYFMGNDPPGFLGPPKNPQAQIRLRHGPGEFLHGEAAGKFNIGRPGGRRPGRGEGSPFADHPEPDRMIRFFDKTGGFGDPLGPVKRKERAEEKNLKTIFRPGRRKKRVGSEGRAENIIIIAQGQDFDFVRTKSVRLTIIPFVSERIGKDEINQGEGRSIDLKIPPGPGRIFAPPAPIDDFRFIAGGQGVENEGTGGQGGQELRRGNVLGAKFGDEEAAPGRSSSGAEKTAFEGVEKKEWISGPGFKTGAGPAFDDFGSDAGQALAENRASRIVRKETAEKFKSHGFVLFHRFGRCQSNSGTHHLTPKFPVPIFQLSPRPSYFGVK